MRIGQKIIELDQVDSTNSYAESLLSRGDPEDGTVVDTKRQTAGKGQGENDWISEPGKNLTLSVILKPGFLRAEEQFRLNKSITLGVCDFLEMLRVPARIKWPNDIYSDSKKIGGILIAHRVLGNKLEYTIAGIGININQVDFPAELPNPTSVARITGANEDLVSARAGLLECLDKSYSDLREGQARRIDTRYLEKLIGAGEWAGYNAGGIEAEGRILDVDAYGRLMIEFRDGTRGVFAHQEISYAFSRTSR